MYGAYVEAISLIERVHRHFLETVRLELDGLGIRDINNVQGLLLFNIGDAEMTISELTRRGFYLGANGSYHLKKMVENGYLVQERSAHDRRSMNVRVTEKGTKMRDRLQSMHQRHAAIAGADQYHRRCSSRGDRNVGPTRALLEPAFRP